MNRFLFKALVALIALIDVGPSLHVTAAHAAILSDKSAIGELTFWNSIKESKNPEDLKVYIDEFPNGMFVDTAVTRFEELTGQRLAIVPQANEVDSAPADTVKAAEKPKSSVSKKAVSKKKPVTVTKRTASAKPGVARKKTAKLRLEGCKLGLGKNGQCLLRTASKRLPSDTSGRGGDGSRDSSGGTKSGGGTSSGNGGGKPSGGGGKPSGGGDTGGGNPWD
jgi:hypothetical protein